MSCSSVVGAFMRDPCQPTAKATRLKGDVTAVQQALWETRLLGSAGRLSNPRHKSTVESRALHASNRSLSMKLKLAALACMVSFAFAAPAQAQTEIQWWHSMGGALGEWVNDL